jgi:hypothetical protein
MPINFVLLFGEQGASKDQLINVVKADSFLNRFTGSTNIKFLRVSMFHMGSEFLLSHR